MADDEWHGRMQYRDRWPGWVTEIVGVDPRDFNTTEILAADFSADLAAEAWQFCVRAKLKSEGEERLEAVSFEAVSATFSFNADERYVHIRFLLKRK